MAAPLRQRLWPAAAWAACVLLTACLGIAAWGTRHWPQISDDVLMHYAVFLLRHGMRPYSQVVDLNMPGAYGIDWLAGHLFGGSAAGWRAFDWCLTLCAGAAMVSATRSVVRGELVMQRHSLGRQPAVSAATFAGFWAAAVFALWHIGDGVAQAAQRDYILAVLLLVGYALFFPACRLSASRGPRGLALMALAGCCWGTAATLKPQAILLPCVLLFLLALRASRLGYVARRAVVAGLLGTLAPLCVMALWLGALGSLGAFLSTARGLMPYHASMARHTGWFLVTHACPSLLLPLLLVACWLAWVRAPRRRFQVMALLAGLVFGFFSFYVQGKAYPYHRYPLIAVLLLFAACEVAFELSPGPSAPGRSRAPKWAAALVVAYGVLWLAPASTARALRYNWRRTPSLDALQADLHALAGPAALQGQVQCMDTMAGCITVLDRMHLVQATGFLYDCYFFAPGPSAVRAEQRAHFLRLVQQKPPRLFIVTDQWCLNLPGGYAKLNTWPVFHQFLTQHYTLAVQRAWRGPHSRYLATWPFGYRIYVVDPAPR